MAGWTADWINIAETLVWEAFEQYMVIEVDDAEEGRDKTVAPVGNNLNVSHGLSIIVNWLAFVPAKRQHLWSVNGTAG